MDKVDHLVCSGVVAQPDRVSVKCDRRADFHREFRLSRSVGGPLSKATAGGVLSGTPWRLAEIAASVSLIQTASAVLIGALTDRGSLSLAQLPYS